MRLVEWGNSPGSPGIVLVPSNARQPLLQCVVVDLLRMDPSGVFKTRIHPHRMVSSLKRLDAPLKEDLQEIHTSDPVTNKLDHSIDQHLHVRLLLREHLQRGGFFHSVHGKGREAGRLP